MPHIIPVLPLLIGSSEARAIIIFSYNPATHPPTSRLTLQQNKKLYNFAQTQQKSIKFETQAPLNPSIKTKAKKLCLSVQFPGKLPGISKIKHISAITDQNKTNLKLKLPRPSIKTTIKKKLSGIRKIKHISAINHQNSTKFETLAPLSPSIKTKAKQLHLSMQFPSKLPGISKIKHSSALTHQFQPNLKLKLP